MIRLIARLHGVKTAEQPDFGQDMPTLVKGSAALAVLASGAVVAHLVALGAGGIGLFLRYGIGYSRSETLILTLIAVVAVLAFGLSALIVWSSRHGKLLMRDRLIAGLALRGDEQVLDVGCGNGLLLIGAAEQLTSGMATGVDIWRTDLESGNSAESVRRNAQLAGVADRVTVQDADAQALPFEDAQYDIILTSFMLHHMKKAARERALKDMLRTLKPGGKLVIVEVLHLGSLSKLLHHFGVTSITQPSLKLPFYKLLVAIK